MITFTQLGNFGRLGNQMFQIAGTVGISRDNGHDYIFPPWPYAGFMQQPLPTGQLENPQRVGETSFHYSPIHLEGGDHDLFGYFQSDRYFRQHADEIRPYFTLHDRHSAELDDLADRYGQGPGTCSIHVRRTDYLGLWQYHPVLSLEYYHDAMDLVGDALFVVFSDDVQWCKANLRGRRFVFVEGQPDIYDLALMSRCEYHIIANSSFSWWGAYLDPNPAKTVIAPDRWFGPAYAHFDTRDLLPETWIRIWS
jgi:hypothetical protein